MGIICGSGLGNLINALDKVNLIVTFSDIPNIQTSTVSGHAGKYVFGQIQSMRVVIMSGRLHYYEGNTCDQVTYPVIIMCLLGIRLLMVTNAAGGLNTSYKVGDIMIIRDHISLPGMSGNTPLYGPVPDYNQLNQLMSLYYGPEKSQIYKNTFERFPSMNLAYPATLQRLLAQSALEAGIEREHIQSGCYVCVSGPSYETPSEVKMLSMLGADAVGMSSIPEVIVAVQYRVQVVAMSLISNEIPKTHFPTTTEWLFDENVSSETPSMNGPGPNHLEVIAATSRRANDLVQTIKIFMNKIEILQSMS